MKQFKEIGFVIFLLVFVFILLFPFFFSLLNCLQKFISIEDSFIIIFSTIASVVLSIVNVVITEISLHSLHQSKFSFWIKNNYPKVILSYLILMFVFMSISNELRWKGNEIREVLTIEWTIFEVSMMVFLVWDVFYVNYLKSKQIRTDDKMDSVKRYKALLNKQTLFSDIVSAKSSIIILTINLFLLALSSGMIYISNKQDSVLTQNIVVCTFYFSTNALVLLFIDILKPILAENKALKKANRITKEELDRAESKALLQTIQESVIKTIDDLDPSESERAKATLKIIEGLNILLDDNSNGQQEPSVDDDSKTTNNDT